MNGVEKGMDFFRSTKTLAAFLLIATSIVTSMFFWITVAIYHNDLFDIAVLMLKVIRSGLLILLVSTLFYYLLYFLRRYLIQMVKEKIKKEEETINAKRKRTKKRSK